MMRLLSDDDAIWGISIHEDATLIGFGRPKTVVIKVAFSRQSFAQASTCRTESRILMVESIAGRSITPA